MLGAFHSKLNDFNRTAGPFSCDDELGSLGHVVGNVLVKFCPFIFRMLSGFGGENVSLFADDFVLAPMNEIASLGSGNFKKSWFRIGIHLSHAEG